jgi:hypothetical protein
MSLFYGNPKNTQISEKEITKFCRFLRKSRILGELATPACQCARSWCAYKLQNFAAF